MAKKATPTNDADTSVSTPVTTPTNDADAFDSQDPTPAEKKSMEVTVIFYHKGDNEMKERTFDDMETAEQFIENPANHWNADGEVKKPVVVK